MYKWKFPKFLVHTLRLCSIFFILEFFILKIKSNKCQAKASQILLKAYSCWKSIYLRYDICSGNYRISKVPSINPYETGIIERHLSFYYQLF